MALTKKLKPLSYDKFEVTSDVFKEHTDRYIFVMKDLNGHVITATTYVTKDIKEAQEMFKEDVKEYFKK